MKMIRRIYFLALLTTCLLFSTVDGVATTYHVKPLGNDTNNGTTWSTAFQTLQKALDVAVSGDQIWVAAGTYLPTKKSGGTSERHRSFVMLPGVKIYGGFAGGETSLGQRNWTLNVTILSGDIGTPGDETDNCYHVLYNVQNGLDGSAVLDGFTVSGGYALGPNANPTDPQFRGAGMYILLSSPTVVNCSFVGNTALLGGGMYILDATPTIVNCAFTGNVATLKGGGVRNFLSAPSLINCTISNNTADNNGGGLANSTASPILTNCIIWGNGSSISNENATPSSGPSIPDITYSIVEGGYNGTGNSNADPLFVDPPNGNFRLQPCSPAIDAGTGTGAPANDLDGNTRPQYAAIDMGAYEYAGTSNSGLANATDLGSQTPRTRLNFSGCNIGFDNSWTASPGSDVFYKINLTANSSIQLLLENTAFNAVLYLLDAGGNQIASDNGPGNSALIRENGLTPGIYYIVVDGHTTSDIGFFNLKINVGDALAVGFVLNPEIGCDLPHTVFFTDQSIKPDTWFWEFGDANNSTAQNPIHSYTSEGLFPVKLTVTDTFSNFTLSITKNVRVKNQTPPTALCKNAFVQLSAAGTYTLTPSEVDNGSNDFTGIAGLSVAPSSFTCSDVGMVEVTLTVTDICDLTSTCTATVTVEDNILPSAKCQPHTVQLDANGNGSLTANDIDNGSSDACGVSLSAAPNTFSCTNIGVNTVTLTVTDSNGKVNTCTSSVTVQDNQKPVPTCKTNTVQLDASGNYTLQPNDVFAGGTDNCTTVNFWKMSPTSVSCSHVGTPVAVLVEVFDASGNQASCTATINVEDITAPTAVCQPHTIQLDASGQASLNAGDLNGGSTDACGPVFFSASPNSFACANIGANTVTLTVTDSYGNHAPCTTTVTVEDNLPPVITCANATVWLDANGQATITQANTFTGSSDNCGFVGLDPLAQTLFDCSHVGPNAVTIEGFDGNGNTTSCTATVTIVDNILPAANCKTTTINATLGSNGQYTIDPNELDNGSSDACGIQSLTATPPVLDCRDEGMNNITLSVTDSNGNTSTCTATVEVTEFLTITSTAAMPETCAGASDGSISVTATAGGGQVKYSIDGGLNYQAAGTFANLLPGNYTVTVKVFGVPAICEKSVTVTVEAGPQPTTWYKDLDGDGYTDYVTQSGCVQPTGYKALAALNGPEEDCDDNKPTWFPGQVWYPDYDVDFYGALPAVVQCSRPAGHRRADNLFGLDTDCDNNNAAINPGATEVCNGIDDDCDGEVDEGLSGLTFTGNVQFNSQAQLDAWPPCYAVIQGNVTINGANIIDLTPLANIVEITGNLTVLTNSSLTSLAGLENLTAVGGALSIYYNFQLSDCCAIDALLAGGGVGGNTTIFFNQSGCNSVAEINTACTVNPLVAGGGTNNTYQSCADCAPTEMVQVFPNPASTTIEVRWSGPTPSGTVQFTDLMGRVLMEQKLQIRNQFNVFSLRSGNYAVRVKADGYKQQVKRVVVDR